MNLKDTYDIAHNNIKGRKKIGRLMSAIFFIAICVYMIVNSMSASIDNMVAKTKEIPMSKLITFREIEGIPLPTDFKEEFSNLDNVVEVIDYYEICGDAFFEGRRGKRDARVVSYTKLYDDYIVEGEKPGKNEILIPHYINQSSNGDYESTSKYIGSEVSIKIENENGEEKSFTYTVSGTYDNVYAAFANEDRMFIEPSEAKEMRGYSIIGWDKNPKPTSEYALVVNKFKNVPKLQDTLMDEYGIPIGNVIDPTDNELEQLFDVVGLVVTVITMLLLAIVIIMMVLMIGNDIRSRKKEMSMYMVQGYTRKELIRILGMEYAIRFVPIMIYASIASAVVMLFENWVLKTFVGNLSKLMTMKYSVTSLVFGVMILVIVLITAVNNISQQIREINLLKEIRSEG